MADNNENKKDGGFNFPPVGGGKNIKAPKFNGYWMYIILAVIIIGFQFFNMNPDPVRTTWQEVKTKMLGKGDIEKITVITNKGQAQVYMKPDKIENYSQLKSQKFQSRSSVLLLTGPVGNFFQRIFRAPGKDSGSSGYQDRL